jgi:hypothetical protein
MDRDISTGSVPERFREDLDYNATRVVALAAIHCGRCIDYHTIYTSSRRSGTKRGLESDRDQFITTIGDELASRKIVEGPKIDIVIGGAADTGLLAAAIRAASTAGEAVLQNTRFTVIDRCGTPLALCQEFGDRQGVDVRTMKADMTEAMSGLEADLVLLHSVFRFIPRNQHVATLKRLGNILKPSGHIVFSSRIQPPSAGGRTPMHSNANDRLVQMVESGEIIPPEPSDIYIARIKRWAAEAALPPENELRTVEEARTTFASAGLTIVSLTESGGMVGLDGGGEARRTRILAILG